MRLQTDVHVRFPTSSNTNIVPRPLRPRNLGTIERYLILTNKVGIRKHTTARYRSVVCPLIKLYQFQFSFEKKLIFDFFQRDKYYARRGDHCTKRLEQDHPSIRQRFEEKKNFSSEIRSFHFESIDSILFHDRNESQNGSQKRKKITIRPSLRERDSKIVYNKIDDISCFHKNSFRLKGKRDRYSSPSLS